MRCQLIRLHWVRISMREPFRISNGEVAARDAILIEINTDAGIGWGEAAPMPGTFYSNDTPESTWEFVRQRLAPAFLEHPEFDLSRLSAWLSEFEGESFAKAGLEGAVCDLLANVASKPLWQILGGSSRPVESGAAIGLMPTVADLSDRVQKFLSEGYRRIKIKIAPGHDVELVRAVRQRFGGIPLMVDANASYTLDHISVFRELDRFQLMMIEQPLAREAIAEHAELQRLLRTPLCLDESADSVAAIEEIIRLRSGRILNIKVQRMGGLFASRRAHDLAQSAGIPCWMGTMPELGIASAQGLHLATLLNFTFPTDIEASARWYVDDIISPQITLAAQGSIRLPGGPGMGYVVDEEKVAQYRLRLEELRA
jgi:o-succinylbenzoate synthase